MFPHSQDPVANLPALDAVGAAHQQRVEAFLSSRIEAEPGGVMPFEQWMGLALYAPGLGYYAAGSEKLGAASAQGDFTTAPELTPLFGQTVARQVAQVLRASASADILEFGAGSGALAAALIPALREMGIAPRYHILEISADLRARQQRRLAGIDAGVQWTDTLPENFTGCVIANEVLDAMPVTLFRWAEDGALLELGVGLERAQEARNTPFVLVETPASPALHHLVAQRMPSLPGYQSEINRQAEAWIRQMGGWLRRGAALIIDYGFPAREYYHPQRAGGTLMCHFRHHAHSHPLIHAGLQDITAHVDFTAMADAALEGGLEVLGYTSQARFLLNTGLAGVVETARTASTGDPEGHYAELAAVQKLVSEAEMGELFKVLAIGRDLDIPLLGFATGDRRHRL
jgi:SAM-dependent MidA family methyltransferase